MLSGAWFPARREGRNTFLCVSAGQMASSVADKLCDLGQMVRLLYVSIFSAGKVGWRRDTHPARLARGWDNRGRALLCVGCIGEGIVMGARGAPRMQTRLQRFKSQTSKRIALHFEGGNVVLGTILCYFNSLQITPPVTS